MKDLGISSIATILTCLGCSKNSGNSVPSINPSAVDFTLDLTASVNSGLLNNGGYLANNGVLVARTANGTYIAVQQS